MLRNYNWSILFLGRIGILLFAFFIAVCSSAAQISAQRGDFNIYDAVRIPRSLQPSLIERLDSFVEAQHTGQWDKVAEMLGPFSSAVSRSQYRVSEKEWVVEKLRSRPMLSFIPKVLTFSTASIDLPLAKRWWNIEGEAEFRAGAKEKMVFALYRSSGEWYFQPMIVTAGAIEPLLKPPSNKRVERTRR